MQMYINITRADAKQTLQVYRKAGIKANVYTTLLNSRIERKEIEMISNTLNSFNDEMYTIEHDSDLNTLTIRYGSFKGKIQLEKEATHGTHINLNFQIINNNSNILNMDTNSIFTGLQNARQNKTMKSFVKETKEQFNIDLSVQGIRATGHHEGQVYNKYAAFERYAKQEQPKRDETPRATPQPKAEPKVKEIQPATDDTTAAAQNLIKLMGNMMNESRVVELINTHRPKIDVSEIKEIIQDIIKDLPTGPTTVVNLNSVKVAEVKGITHPEFQNILQVLQAGCYAYIFGPAGSGKTYTARQAATALNIPFYSISLCAQTTEVKLTGYMNANGFYVETSFFKAFTQGGVFCLDEIDNSNANVVTVLNNALSGETYGFPHGEFTKHKDFRVVATANTIGNGATVQYVGRNPLDKAASDRFEFIRYDYDPVMELSLCNGNKDIYNMVVHARNVLKDTKALISPRATASIYKLTSVGMDIKTAYQLSIVNKLTDNEKQILCK